jgi:hypothetical protein
MLMLTDKKKTTKVAEKTGMCISYDGATFILS